MNAFLPIENYVPHRGVMLLLDCLLDASADSAHAQVTVPRDGLFLQDAGMPAWVGLEYMAQTVAAWAGWQAVQAGRPVKLGFLLGTRKFQAACAHFSPGSVLRVSVHCELVGTNGLGMFDCRIQPQGEDSVLAQARISVYEPDNGSAFIQALEQEGVGQA
ncbi:MULTISPECIES: ApeP family dehydratase [Delftia]|jgi:predicted hotdog family 3-hydroxylacyl-ACP dehydratase|uniref:ApeP family dehydratase n=1 Tax=Delftia TaxID=80865 RepID=UPI000BDC28FA|nr:MULTISPECIES: hotdog family protein [Delftia]MCG3784419.1 hotdog family protein [Delftia acidovorans]SOE36649.1 Predicted 3-hydroxylacyl-ACP dehydratase, HotDog domain [Delftia acidovorans]